MACRRSNTLRRSVQEQGLCVDVTLEKLMNWVPKGQSGSEAANLSGKRTEDEPNRRSRRLRRSDCLFSGRGWIHGLFF